jgi:hypothetical protein
MDDAVYGDGELDMIWGQVRSLVHDPMFHRHDLRWGAMQQHVRKLVQTGYEDMAVAMATYLNRAPDHGKPLYLNNREPFDFTAKVRSALHNNEDEKRRFCIIIELEVLSAKHGSVRRGGGYNAPIAPGNIIHHVFVFGKSDRFDRMAWIRFEDMVRDTGLRALSDWSKWDHLDSLRPVGQRVHVATDRVVLGHHIPAIKEITDDE